MIIKSYEISGKRLDQHNFILVYGDNEGLKQEIIDKLKLFVGFSEKTASISLVKFKSKVVDAEKTSAMPEPIHLSNLYPLSGNALMKTTEWRGYSPPPVNRPCIGLLNETIACLRMLSQYYDLPFRKDLLKKVIKQNP